MTIYIVLIGIVGVVSLFARVFRNKSNRSKLIIIFTAAAIVVIQGLRHSSVGTDTMTYLQGLYMSRNLNVLDGGTLFNFEIGYIMLSQLLATLNVTDTQFLFIIAIIIITPISVVLIKKSRMPGLSALMYISLGYFLFSFSGIRQAIAISITFYSFSSIEKREILKFSFFIFIATLFHQTAIIFAIAYGLYSIRIKRIHLPLVLIFLFGVYLFRTHILSLSYRLLTGNILVVENTGAHMMFLFLLVAYGGAYLINEKKDISPSINLYRNFLLISLAVQIFSTISNTVMRAGFYYSIFLVLLVPELIMNQKQRSLRVLLSFVVIAISISFFLFQLINGHLDTNPYSFFWQ